jgi:hypothetical protein
MYVVQQPRIKLCLVFIVRSKRMNIFALKLKVNLFKCKILFIRKKLLPPLSLNGTSLTPFQNTQTEMIKAFLNSGKFSAAFAQEFTDFYQSGYDKISFCGVRYLT